MPPRLDALFADALDRAIRTLLPHRDPIGGVHVVRITSITGGSIDESIRSAVQRLYRSTHGRAGGIAIVLDVEGFASAAMRSMFSGVLLLTRGTLTQRVFSDVPSALAWIAPLVAHHEPDAPSATTLREALRNGLRALEAG